MGTLLEASTLSPGETRGLASRVLRYFVDAGALEGRVLSMGWHGEFLPMVQPFSGPASRYWASKGFLGLLVPADHSVRTAEEQPLPVEQADFCRAMAQLGFFVVGTVADGVVRVFTGWAARRPLRRPRPIRTTTGLRTRRTRHPT